MAEEPPALDEIDEVDGYWTEDTTITVPRYVKAHLDENRDGQNWGPYLEKLRRVNDDPLTMTEVDEIADRLAEQLEMNVDYAEIEHRLERVLERMQ